jgi:protein involved in polysaccharide export with SLBB domain
MMKKMILPAFAMAISLTVLAFDAPAQVQSVAAANKQTAPRASASDKTQVSPQNTTRSRTLAQDTKTSSPKTLSLSSAETALQAHAKKVSKKSSDSTPTLPTLSASDNVSANLIANRSRVVLDSSAKSPGSNAAPAPLKATPGAALAATASQVYRVGVRDVLDIQLPGQTGKESTLFTVVDGGLLEYPLAGGPFNAAGMTTAEVAALLRQRIRILDNPAVVVKVRDYASHPVTISGFVAAPGVKNLRREAVPLYTLLAEALMLPEAASATITRQGRAPIHVDLKDLNLASTLVLPGDAIRVSGTPAAPSEFFFVGGEIASPGQKPFHVGVTLTQAILASGGTTRSAGSKIRVSRQGADGRLLTEEYNLRKIQDGKNPDPVLQKGDRIQVGEDR